MAAFGMTWLFADPTETCSFVEGEPGVPASAHRRNRQGIL